MKTLESTIARTARRQRRVRPDVILAFAAAGLLSAACASIGTDRLPASAPVPASPQTRADVPPPPPPPQPTPVAIPERLLAPGARFTLGDVVDIALRNSPITRASWLQARSAAAQLGNKRSLYYPSLDLTASASRSKQSALGGQFEYLQTTYGPTLTLNMLLLDLGGRSAGAEEARLALLSADWSHDASLQNVVFGVQQVYFQYLGAKAQLEAAQSNLKEAQTVLDAATTRHDAGVATVADVLQARTALSQAQLAVDAATGQVMTIRGSLATAMGLPANTPYDVDAMPADAPIDTVSGNVEELIAKALAARPDLAAARLLAEKATTHILAVRSDGLPSLSASASAGRSYYQPAPSANYGDAWSARVLLTVPLFHGFADSYNLAKAREDAAVAGAQTATLEQQVVLQVWSSFYGLQTAAQLVRSSRDLLASAEQSERVALARYREGVGSLIDLLTAQATLASARAQEIAARSSWYVAVAQLARDTGTASPTLQAGISLKEERKDQ